MYGAFRKSAYLSSLFGDAETAIVQIGSDKGSEKGGGEDEGGGSETHFE